MDPPASRARSPHHDEEAALLQPPDGPVLGWVKRSLPQVLAGSAALLGDADLLFDQHFGIVSPALSPASAGPAAAEDPLGCGAAGCTRRIGPASSRFECPACRQLYCSTHAGHPAFEVALPAGAGWMRVCAACWRARPENQAAPGAARSWLAVLEKRRRAARRQAQERRSLLEKRLGQLIRLEGTGGAGDRRAAQREIVSWKADEAVAACPTCAYAPRPAAPA